MQRRPSQENRHYFQAIITDTPPCFVFFAETSGLWNDGAGDDGIAAPLDEVHYTYNVLNNGTVTLTNFTVTDTVIVGTVCSEPSLPPGESFTCDANTYLVSACEHQRILRIKKQIERAAFAVSFVLRCTAVGEK